MNLATLTSLPLVALFILPLCAGEFYVGNKNILRPTSDRFDKLVTSSRQPLLVEFYSPGCPHCVSLRSTWESLAENLSPHIRVAAVNCKTEALCSRWNVKGVPSIKLFANTDQKGIVPIDYNEERSLKSLVNFAKRHQPSEVIKITATGKTGSVDLDEFLKKSPQLPHLIMFKSGKMTASMGLKTLSTMFTNKLVVGVVNASNDGELAARLGVKVPSDKDSLVIIPAGEGKGRLYEGKLTFSDMRDYLRDYLESLNNSNFDSNPKSTSNSKPHSSSVKSEL